MASAIYDIPDGQSEENDPNTNPFLHDEDGVGAIDIASAKYTARELRSQIKNR